MLVAIIGPYEARVELREKEKGTLALSDIEHSERLVQELLEKAQGASLFGERYGYRLANLLSRDDSLDEVLPHLSDSPHLFLIEEDKLLKNKKELLAEAGARVFEAGGERAVPSEHFNLFALADAMGGRDRKKLWLLLTKALQDGYEPEEIAGVLHWQARAMLAASRASSAREAGLKEFVYGKAKRYGSLWGADLSELSRTLLSVYHQGHRGDDMALLLERFALKL